MESIFILRTAETWRLLNSAIANVYIGQLSYLFSDKPIRLSDDPLAAWLEAAARGIDGFSIVTGPIKLIASKKPVIFAPRER